MNKNAIFAHFSSILDNMIDNSLFFKTFFQSVSSIEDIEGSIDDPALPENIKLYFGATRCCILDDDYDYIVKFDVDEDGISGSACKRELEIYSRAKSLNLDPYFCEMEYIGSYTKTFTFYDFYQISKYMDYYYLYGKEFDNEFNRNERNLGEMESITISIPLYAYRKAESHWCCDHEIKEESISTAQKIESPMRERNLAIAADFIQEYGEEIYKKVSIFMLEENINDLHLGNIGNIDNHMVFYDFAGFHSESYNSEVIAI